MNKALFVPSNDTQVKTFFPICHYLTQENIACHFLILDDYYNQNSLYMFKGHSYDITTLKNQRYKGVNIFHVSRFERIKLIITIRKQLSDILKEIRPGIIVVSNDYGLFEYLCVRWAKKNNIPSLLIQDGLRRDLKKNSIKHKTTRILKNIATKLVADFYPTNGYAHSGCTKIAVSGSSTKRKFIREGINADKIEITGQPRYDNWQKHRAKSSPINTGKPIIVFASQPFALYQECSKEEEDSFLVNLAKTMAQIEGLDFWIKLHPRDSKDYIHNLFSSAGIKDITLVNDKDIYEVLNQADLLLAVNSTVISEAIFLGIPVIIIDFPCSPWSEPENSSLVSKKVFDLADLPETINTFLLEKQNVLNSESVDKFVFDHIYLQDGEASKRITTIISQLLENSG